MPRDLQGTWDWTVRHGEVSTGGWNPYLKEALQTMFETGLPAIIYEELTGEDYHPVDGAKHVRQILKTLKNKLISRVNIYFFSL